MPIFTINKHFLQYQLVKFMQIQMQFLLPFWPERRPTWLPLRMRNKVTQAR